MHVLVRETSRTKLAAQPWVADERVIPVVGDLSEPLLGIDPDRFERTRHIVHLGAIYDLTASDEANRVANVEGTRNVLAFAAAAKAQWLHHVRRSPSQAITRRRG